MDNISKQPLFTHQVTNNSASVHLHSASSLSKASHFLWNEELLVQVNCQGYVNAQFMQPEPCKYSKGPNIESTTFMQPEMPYYADHPGRFVFIKDEDSGKMFSAPYAPMKLEAEHFEFIGHSHQIVWKVEHLELELEWKLTLPAKHTVELWCLNIRNKSEKSRKLSVTPCFSIGFMSWMNQAAVFDASLNSIVAQSVTPYQKVEDYFAQRNFKDITFLHSNKEPDSWCANLQEFVGRSGIQDPEALQCENLSNAESCYETPVAAMQFRIELATDETESTEFIFGPACSKGEVQELITRYSGKYRESFQSYKLEQKMRCGEFEFLTGNSEFDNFVNYWLPRQAIYHGELNRLTTDPQTRNFLQDTMALLYFSPEKARERLLLAISQQQVSGQMPDGILLNDKAKLKYINQIPHTDHCVWLVLSVKLYLDETADESILHEQVGFVSGSKLTSVANHVELAIEWLLSATDESGLSYIEQGDWCDPMNMVGYKGVGVSSWLSIATCYALSNWLDICNDYLSSANSLQITEYKATLDLLRGALRKHFKVGNWFARGITDDGRIFGVASDEQGQIFLNPQSWALLANVFEEDEVETLCREVMQRLATSFGVCMLAPAYTQMVEDIGRVTQKFPGSAENGSVYNHAAAFWGFAMFEQGKAELGFDVLKRMISHVDNAEETGQLPSYIPNYYRGARTHSPEHLGRSSHLFNTGTIAWYLRSLFEGLAGFRPCKQGVIITPKLPADMKTMSYSRNFRGARFQISIKQTHLVQQQQTFVNNLAIEEPMISELEAGTCYNIDIHLPWQPVQQKKLIVLTGVSGSGKSTLAKEIAEKLEYVYMEADEFHSRAAIRKMAQGKPLKECERSPWIERMRQHLLMLETNLQNVVLAYSGLKHEHRKQIQLLPFDVEFYHLELEEEELKSRLNKRSGHFFDRRLLTSQLEDFEPYREEEGEIVNGAQPIHVLAETIISRIQNEF